MADEVNGKSSIRKQVEARIEEERKQLPDPDDKGDSEISSKFVRDCLFANEMGDGILLSTLHEGQFLYDKLSQQWLTWQGHHWELDIDNANISMAVEEIASCYLAEAYKVGKQLSQIHNKEEAPSLQNLQDAFFRRAKRLRSCRGRRNCVEMARSNPVNAMSITGDQFDFDPWLLGVRNGVIDLRTGNLRPGRRGDLITKASDVDYHGVECPCSLWMTTLREIFKGDQSLIDFLARLFGYSITGLYDEHILPVLWGPRGRNGKGTVVETISAIMGPLATVIQSEMLLDQWRPKTASSASADIMSLRGRRFVFASESDEGRHFSLSKTKWLTGGDTLTGRSPYDKYETTFIPSHTLFLQTNEKPTVKGDDASFWERLILIPFERSFVTREVREEHERPANRFLRSELKRELPGILAWLVRGCLQWQEGGLNPPPVVQQAAAAYRRDEDLLGSFIDECCYVDPRAEVQAKRLHDAFSTWWENNLSKKAPGPRRFAKMMMKRFNKEKRGSIMYAGLSLLADE